MKSFLALLFCCSFIPLAIAENNDCIVPSIKPVSLSPNETDNKFSLFINKYIFQLKEKPVSVNPMSDTTTLYFDKLAGKRSISIGENYESYNGLTPKQNIHNIFGLTQPPDKELKNIIIGRQMLGIDCGSATNVFIYKLSSDNDMAFVVNSNKYKGTIFVKITYSKPHVDYVTDIVFEGFTQEEVNSFIATAKTPRRNN